MTAVQRKPQPAVHLVSAGLARLVRRAATAVKAAEAVAFVGSSRMHLYVGSHNRFGIKNHMKFSNISRAVIFIALFLQLVGCASQSMDISRSANPAARSVKRIALMPGGGVLADAVGIQLMNLGFDVVDMGVATNSSARVNLNELEFAQPANLKDLANKYGVDCVLIVKSVGGYDDKPSSAAARLLDTRTGSLLAGVTWQNGKGGAQGSPADNLMRSDVSTSAKKLAAGIASTLR